MARPKQPNRQPADPKKKVNDAPVKPSKTADGLNRGTSPIAYGVHANSPILSASDAAVLAASGAQWVRIPFFRERVTSGNGLYNWTKYDQSIKEITRYGVKVLPVMIDATMQIDGSKTSPDDPENRDNFAAFVENAVFRYKPGASFWSEADGTNLPITHWEIWNEPNTNQFAIGKSPDPQDIIDLLKEVTPRLKAVDSAAQVIIGGVTLNGHYEANAFIDAFYDKGNVKDLYDIWGLHPYAHSGKETIEGLDQMVKTISRHDPDCGIFVTEFGFGDSGNKDGIPRVRNTTVQADELRKVLNGVPARPKLRVKCLIWYSLADVPGPPADATWVYYAGLTKSNLAPKPAYGEFKKHP